MAVPRGVSDLSILQFIDSEFVEPYIAASEQSSVIAKVVVQSFVWLQSGLYKFVAIELVYIVTVCEHVVNGLRNIELLGLGVIVEGDFPFLFL